ncbi:MAG: hypothetical protein AVDCRST_MAG65-1528, partial [uncultured Solirubrobacteraceae bacterium]
ARTAPPPARRLLCGPDRRRARHGRGRYHRRGQAVGAAHHAVHRGGQRSQRDARRHRRRGARAPSRRRHPGSELHGDRRSRAHLLRRRPDQDDDHRPRERRRHGPSPRHRVGPQAHRWRR